MKMSIEWHEDCLANRLAYVDRKKNELNIFQREIERMNKEIDYYKFQISEAILEKRDEFDSERFRKGFTSSH